MLQSQYKEKENEKVVWGILEAYFDYGSWFFRRNDCRINAIRQRDL
jgi:hypothetical protein